MWNRLPRVVRVFTPFFLLVIAVLLYRAWDSPAPAPETLPPAMPQADTEPLPANAVPTAVPATTAVPIVDTAVPTRASLPPGPLVRLAGPPTGAVLPLTAPTSFYWTADYVPLEDQRFDVVIIAPSGETVVGGLQSPNLGERYQVRAIPAELGLGSGEYQWAVRLIDNVLNASLWQSAARPVDFKEDGS